MCSAGLRLFFLWPESALLSFVGAISFSRQARYTVGRANFHSQMDVCDRSACGGLIHGHAVKLCRAFWRFAMVPSDQQGRRRELGLRICQHRRLQVGLG
jgi:hypothetical protein